MVFSHWILPPGTKDYEHELLVKRLKTPFGFEDTDNNEMVRGVFRCEIRQDYTGIIDLYILSLAAELNFSTNMIQAKYHIHMEENPNHDVADLLQEFNEAIDESLDQTIEKINCWFDEICGAVDVYNYPSESDALDISSKRTHLTPGHVRQFYRLVTGYRPKPKS